MVCTTAYWVTDIVYVAAKLGLADHLAEAPKSADELAGPTRTPRTFPLPSHEDAREPRHLDRECAAPLFFNAAGRRAQDWRTRLGACHNPNSR
jgi:hypothetical protein